MADDQDLSVPCQNHPVVTLEPSTARSYWRALLTNAAGLIRDAHTLFDAGSFARVRALSVLAEEELGKATAVYDRFSHAWSDGDDDPIDLPTETSRFHLAKYAAAYEFGRELEAFWGGGYELLTPEDDDWEGWHETQRAIAEAAAKTANLDKQQGFYVDLDGATLSTPDRFTADDVGEHLVRAAQVIEMMLIKDHTRMQAGNPSRFDDTHDIQWTVMPTSHGEEYADFLKRRGSQPDLDT